MVVRAFHALVSMTTSNEALVRLVNALLIRNASASGSGSDPPSSSRMTTRLHTRKIATNPHASPQKLVPYVEVPPLPHMKNRKFAFDGVHVPPTPSSRGKERRVFDGVELTSSRTATRSQSSERRKAETGFIGVVIPISHQAKRPRRSSRRRI